MAQAKLFHTLPASPSEGLSDHPPDAMTGKPRLCFADRMQQQMRVERLDALVPADARVRAFWTILDRLDLSAFSAPIKSVEGARGRPAIDRKILLCLWLYGMSEGVVHASELAELGEMHDAYRWIRGGVSVSDRTLREFRASHGAALMRLFQDLLVVMSGEGLIDMSSVAQDGLRVRASAGGRSFRREASLQERLATAKARVEEIEKLQADPDTGKARRTELARRAREAKHLAERVDRALAELSKLGAPQSRSHKKKSERREPRASSTDPQSRVMRMGDGGFRPAYNFQFATETKARVIVGVALTNVGGDSGLMEPMLHLLEQSGNVRPKEYFVDGGFLDKRTVDVAASRSALLYAPVPDPRDETVDRYADRPDDSAATKEWRRRMGTEDGKKRYRKRAEIAEGANADLRVLRGLDRLPVRGLARVLAVGLLAALASNFVRYVSMSRSAISAQAS